MEVVHVVFWGSLFMVVYPYIVYPILLYMFSNIFHKPIKREEFIPHVTLIISVHNEERVIADKLDNTLALEYPREKTEIIVASDGSNDKTDEIVNGYAIRGIRLKKCPRQGKTACLNDAVTIASGEVILFSDANSHYDSGAVKEIVKNFADPTVGVVAGGTTYVHRPNSKLHRTPGLHSDLEHWIKKLESTTGSCVGADGAIFAVRKRLFQPLKEGDINDFVIPLKAVLQKYRVVFEKKAICYEETSKDLIEEFRRQVRITNRTLRGIFAHLEWLNLVRYPMFVFKLISHKLIRFFVPIFLLGAVSSNIALWHFSILYKGLLMCHIIIYLIAFGSIMYELKGGYGHRLSVIGHFIFMNAAIGMGWWSLIRGKRFVTWYTVRS